MARHAKIRPSWRKNTRRRLKRYDELFNRTANQIIRFARKAAKTLAAEEDRRIIHELLTMTQ